MVKIYTKTGDSGTTSLFGGTRILKSDAQVEAYGDVDELTSFIGLTIAHLSDETIKQQLTEIQKDLYQAMTFLAGMNKPLSTLSVRVTALENQIDMIEHTLPKLTRFILPQGGVVSSLFHVVRTVCRRSERAVVKLIAVDSLREQDLQTCLRYLNRLSDLMFVMARAHEQTPELST